MRLIKFFTMLCVFIFIVACGGGSDGGGSSGSSDNTGILNGSGTESDPYQIADEDDLKYMTNNLTAVYKLTADIFLTEEWTPVGTFVSPFSGTFHGNGFKITGLSINTDGVLAGLFGVIKQGRVDRLIIEHKSMTNSNQYGYIAALAGWLEDSVIDNVAVRPVNLLTDSISCTGANCIAGGLAADVHNSTITAVYTTGHIESGFFAGGVVGLAANSSVIRSSYAAGNISSAQRAGGVANYVVDGSTVENSAYIGASITGTYTGRIVDDHDTFTINVLSNNYASNTLSGTWKDDKNDTDGMGVPPDSFKDSLWYVDTLPWLSSGIWKIDLPRNNSLPILSWE